MLRFVLVLSLVLVANGRHLHKFGRTKLSHRIVGGQETTIEKRPYQASLILNDDDDYYLCGGSILSSDWILTAARCLQGIKKIQVRVGSANLFSGGQLFETIIYRVHPLYNRKTNDYDVGVVRLSRNAIVFDNSTVKRAVLADSGSFVQPGTPVTISGWGSTSENGHNTQNLMEVTVETLNTSKCTQVYSEFTNRMICAGVQGGGKDSCEGDTGGPLVTNENIQVGIVSYRTGCGRSDFPGVYTNISAVRNWIKANTRV